MLDLLISAVIACLLFGCAYIGFRCGLRLGIKAAQGEAPKPFRNPVQVVTEHIAKKEAKQAAKQIEDEWTALENFDGYTDAERKLVYKDGGGK